MVRGHKVYFTAWDKQDIGEQESGFSGALVCMCVCVCVLVSMCSYPCVLILASLY